MEEDMENKRELRSRARDEVNSVKRKKSKRN